MGSAYAASALDLSVSSYTWSPDPAVHGGTSTFTVTVTNNDNFMGATNLSLVVNLPSNIDFSTAVTSSSLPAGCVLSAGNTVLTCTKASLAAQGTWSTAFQGVGSATGAQQTTATVSATGNADPNATNDALTKNTTVVPGADLSVAITGAAGCTSSCSTGAGSSYSFSITASNSGPDPATTFRVTATLPTTADYSAPSASGSGWSCGIVGTALTCDYSGSNVASGASAPAITLSGTVVTIGGSISVGSVSIASTDSSTPDPVNGNNGPASVTVIVTAGTNLSVTKTMVSASTGLTTFVANESVTMTLQANNTGTQAATGVIVSDTVPADFTLGTMPGGCSKAGQVVTCTPGGMAAGASTSYSIPLTVVAAPTIGSGTNTATISRSTPPGGTNTPGVANYTISAPFAHLMIAKTKAPNLVAAGGNITNTITVTNSSSSTSTATGTIRMTDLLDPNETFVGYTGTGWICTGVSAGATGTVVCTFAGANLARGASLADVVITTQAGASYLGTITNTACTGQSASSPHTPTDNSSANNCQSRSITGTPRHVDLTVAKSASIASPTRMLVSDNTMVYTLTVSNAGPDAAPTVQVSDPLAGWHSGATGSAVITGQVAGESCSFGSTVNCTLLNLGVGSRTITVTVNRPIVDGNLTNTASVSTPDAIEANVANNSGSAAVIVDPISDVTVTSISPSPATVKVGVPVTFTTAFRNNGPSSASGVVVYHTIDPTKMSYVAGTAAITGAGGASCSYQASFAAGPYVGSSGIQCSGFSMADASTRNLSFQAIPVYPFPGAPPFPASYDSNAAISTTTFESDGSNNTAANALSVTIQALDLSVTVNDTGHDPTAFADDIVYSVKAQNNGPSQATGLQLSVTPTAPPGGSPQAYSMLFNASGSLLPGGSSCSQPGGAGTAVLCYLGANQAASTMAASGSATFSLAFTTGPSPADSLPASVTYSVTAVVSSSETSAGYDTVPGNNTVQENTTVLPKTNLVAVSMAVDKPSVSLNEPFVYTLVVGNLGPSAASGVKVTDVLPAGLVIDIAAAITATPGAGFSLPSNSCSSAGTPVTVTCSLGTLPVAASTSDTPNLVTITIPVKALYPAYTGPFGSAFGNSGSIAPLPNTSLDDVAGNNTSNSVNVTVTKSSLAGTVYADNDRSDSLTSNSAEGIAGVTLTLSGADNFGNTLSNIQATTASTPLASKGNFLFDNLPPSNASGYSVVETQPTGYYDRNAVAGTSGGTVDNSAYDINSPHKAISAVVLAANTAATGYLFQDYRQATISGFVYSDLNNDGVRAASGEAAISNIQVTITGTDYAGGAVNLSATTNGSGYTINVPPSAVGGSYTVTEQTQPAGYYDGKDRNGVGQPVANSAGRVAPEGIVVGQVDPNITYANRDFGELLYSSLAGNVFVDANGDGLRQGGETGGIAGVTMTLSGTDHLGQDVCTSYPATVTSCTVASSGTGTFTFGSLPPGNYTLAETVPSGLVHTGAQAGNAGGTGGTGIAATSVSAIALGAGTSGTGYNFGENGQALTGAVYVDVNANGVHDVGEPGVASVNITLTGNTSGGTSVCTVMGAAFCTATTSGSGTYSFTNIPASDATGYTITEQSQATAPLSNYADGTDALGTVNGLAMGSAAVNDRFSGIIINVGESGGGYTFGELGSSLAGVVYVDANNDGIVQGGETLLAGVTLTLSGNSTSGSNVCGLLASCTTTTDGNGSWSFTGLPSSGAYTVTETQPGAWGDGKETAGTAGGTVSNGVFDSNSTHNAISAIALGVHVAATGYNFGEQGAAIAGTVYHDANADGTFAGSDVGVSGVTITLTGTDGGGNAVNVSTTSAANGTYSFSGLTVANGSGYTLTRTLPGGWITGHSAKGKINGATCAGCNITVNGQVSAIALVTGSTFAGFDFGLVHSVTLAGQAYVDINANSTLDLGEALSGVTLRVTGNDDFGTAVNTTTTTVADGSYSFAGLRPSSATGYTVTETQPSAYADFTGTTGTSVGSAGGTAAANTVSGIVLGSGATATGYDFRDKAASLAGFVYVDTNNDGLKGGSELAIAGVTVTLSCSSGGCASACAAINCTTTTAADGSYSFVGLPAGTWAIAESQPGLYQDGKETAGTLGGNVDNTAFDATSTHNTISAIAVAAGQAGTGYLFGDNFAGSIAGTVYVDANDNGVVDTGEARIAGVTLALSGTISGGGDPCSVIASCTTTSNAGGAWSFGSLPPGSYAVTETQPVAYGDGRETVGTAGGTANNAGFDATAAHNAIAAITLAGGQAATGYDFGERTASLSGSVYNDINADGSFGAGDAGIAGVTITLTGTDVLGAAVNLTTTTAANGSYVFNGLLTAGAAGYAVIRTPPSGWLPGHTSQGLLDGATCAACNTATANQIRSVPVQGDHAFTGFDFGEVHSTSLAGHAWLDINANGTRDAGEALAGITLTLSGNDDLGTVVNVATTTSADGSYLFNSLRPSNSTGYTITETQPAGYADFSGSTGTVVGTAGGTAAANATSAIVLGSGVAGTGYDFRDASASLAGVAWFDDNADGLKGAGETGIAGITITLSGTTGAGANVCTVLPSCTALSATDGSYAFLGLPAGSYTLTETQPLAYQDGREVAGTLGGTVDNTAFDAAAAHNAISTISVGAGQAGTGYLFGDAHASGSLAGIVYVDANNDGIHQAGEAAIGGVTVTLSGQSTAGTDICTLIASCMTTSAADGSFGFTGLLGGTYVLTESQPVAFGDGKETVGTAGGAVNNATFGATGATNQVQAIALAAAQAGTGYAFGERSGTLSGTVYNDVDANAAFNTGDVGVQGVTLTLTGTDVLGAAVSLTTTTAANGSYSLTGLLTANASGYTVTKTTPSGWLDAHTAKGLVDGAACAACNTATANQVRAIALQPDHTFTGFDFGMAHATSLAGRAWVDANANGTFDAGEALAGVTLALTGTDDLGASVNIAATSAADGSYLFNALRPSDATGYTVTETQPADYADFTGSTGTIIGTAAGTPVANAVSGIVLGSGNNASGYDFREHSGTLAGAVYLDANDDGQRQAGETGIAGVIVTVSGTTGSGTDICAVLPACTTASAADGSFRFVALPGGHYTLTETQPVLNQDGRESAGSPAGTIDNTGFDATPVHNAISGVALAAGQDGTGYLYGERPGATATVSGRVWFNSLVPDNIQQPGEPGLPGWIVELSLGGTVVATATTGADGGYTLTGITPGTGYVLRFRNPVNHVVYGNAISSEPGVQLAGGEIRNVTIGSGVNIVGQDLPTDPSGVVYDSVTRQPVAGATVAFTGPAGFDAATQLVGGAANASQVTGSNGFYQFLLAPTAPTGTYAIAVTPPAGYVPGVSVMLPPGSGSFDPGPAPGRGAVQQQASPPTGQQPTPYYLRFTLGSGKGDVINNHVPVDPILSGALVVTDATPSVNVSRGDLVAYTVTATNQVAATLPNIALQNLLPPGFRYRIGSATLGGHAAEPHASGRVLGWPALTFAPKETKVFKLVLVVGAGVGDGEYTHSASALNEIVARTVSNTATAVVRVTPDPTFDCSDLIGRVYEDRNHNGVADDGEPGVGGIRLVSPRGLVVTTDTNGRYHIACAEVPQADHGSNFVLKLDVRSLPAGFVATTQNPGDTRLTAGKLGQLDFGVAPGHVAVLELARGDFEASGNLPGPALLPRIDALLAGLKQQPGTVALRYAMAPGEDEAVVRAALATVEARLQSGWHALGQRTALPVTREWGSLP